jgi:hypothetical protein
MTLVNRNAAASDVARRQSIVNGLRAATLTWLVLGGLMLLTDGQTQVSIVVVIGAVAASMAACLSWLLGTTGDSGAQSASDRFHRAPDLAMPEQAGAARTRTVAPPEPLRPPTPRRSLVLADYPSRELGETQCPRCGNVFVDTTPRHDCAVCGLTWHVSGPNEPGPDVLIRSWLHRQTRSTS